MQLLPGMTASVTVITEQDDNAVLVPNSAIAYARTRGGGSGSAVYVMQNGAPVRVAVQTGNSDATNTLVDVVVFVPVALMGGVIGMYFKQFGLTVATATLFSMYVSFTLTPMLTARWTRWS